MRYKLLLLFLILCLTGFFAPTSSNAADPGLPKVFFSPATNFPAGVGPGQSATGDFNGDGRLDLAVTNQNTNSVSILLGNGNGTFGAPTNFAAGTSPRSLAAGDFNGDGSQDLVLVNAFSNNVSILATGLLVPRRILQ